MDSFFEKLKKGMGVEEPIVEKGETEETKTEEATGEENKSSSSSPFAAARIIETKTSKKPKKTKRENKVAEFEIKTLETEPSQRAKVEKRTQSSLTAERSEGKEEKEEKTKISLTVQTETPEETIKEEVRKEPKERKVKKWPSFGREEEGQLTIDVYQTENDLVIQSAIAGVKPENLDISIERDIIIIKGSREKSTGENGDYFIRECFWGPFSREVILPAEVDPSRAKASFKEGILTIRMPKIEREKKRKISISA